MALDALSPAVAQISSSLPAKPRLKKKVRDQAEARPHTLPISIQLANHHIRRMTDDRTPNPRNIPSQETHPRLLQLVITLLRPPQRLIDIRHRRLKRRKLHHRVRDLPAPQRRYPLIQPRIPLSLHDLAPTLP